jgi:poly(A) polymerase
MSGTNNNTSHYPLDTEATIYQRAEHNVSRGNIAESALKVLYRLHKAGYQAYLVGGAVRDLILGKHPKDYDVATDATPEQVKDIFRNCRLIGRRFRLAHIHFGREIVEVATFRGHHAQAEEEGDGLMRDGMIVRDNVFGTLAEDAWRRDFSVNALYYNIADFTVVDYTGGMEDLRKHRLRMIGDAEVRCQEDPVRMLRAIRFAAKIGFQLDSELVKAITEQGHRIEAVPPARLFDEVLKLFMSGHALATFDLLHKYNLLVQLFPATAHYLDTHENMYTFISQACKNTDQRVAESKPVTPAFLFAFMLWGPVEFRAQEFESNNMSPIQALQEAGRAVLNQESGQISIPKRFRLPIREIWTSQARLKNRRGKRPFVLLEQPRFRAAYDFLLLRCQSYEPELQSLCDWWTEFQSVSDKQKKIMCQELHQARQGRKPARSKKKKKPVVQKRHDIDPEPNSNV